MKKTRLFLAASLLTIGAFSTTIMTSCDKDDKICDAGYEGDDCNVEVRAKMIGSYTAADVNTADASDAPSYVAQISNGNAVTVVNIANFSGGGSVGGFSNLVVSNIESSGDGVSFSIPTQTPDNDGYSVSGSGNFNATTKKITIQYTIANPVGQTNNYTGTWTKN
jgi:hypothetical protein